MCILEMSHSASLQVLALLHDAELTEEGEKQKYSFVCE